jgi:YegS/Rv2252/BmrU family lipid kinase
MPRALIINNPYSRGGRASTIKLVVAALAQAGWVVDSVEAHEPAEIAGHAGAAVADRIELVVAVGGDGTVIQAASPLVGTDVALGIVPGGTGNLLAGNLGIPRRAASAARVLAAGHARRIDLGTVEMAGVSRYFAVACGTGFDAQVIAATHPAGKRRWGKIAYFGTAVSLGPRLRNVPHVIDLDGRRMEVEAAEVIVANLGEMIPGLLRPRLPIVPDDGLLDVVVLTVEGPLQGLLGVWETLTYAEHGVHPGGRVFRAQARSVRIEATPPQPVELDGDVHGETPLRATVVPGAISIIVPG